MIVGQFYKKIIFCNLIAFYVILYRIYNIIVFLLNSQIFICLKVMNLTDKRVCVDTHYFIV